MTTTYQVKKLRDGAEHTYAEFRFLDDAIDYHDHQVSISARQILKEKVAKEENLTHDRMMQLVEESKKEAQAMWRTYANKV